MCPISPWSRMMVVPVGPLGGGELDLGERLPGPLGFDQLGFVEADRALHQGIVVGITDRSDGGGDAGGVQMLGEPETRVLRPGVRVMDQLARLYGVLVAIALPDGHLQGVQDENGLLHGGGRPADDSAGEGVHDERGIDDARPGLDVGEVRHPAPVRGLGDEVTVETVRSPVDLPAGERGDHAFAADRALDAEFAHEALDGAAGHGMPLPVQLAPDLPGPVDTVVGGVDLADQLLEHRVPHRTC